MKDCKMFTSLLKYILFLHIIFKEAVKIIRLHSCIRPSYNTHPGFSGTNVNQSSHEIFPRTKIIKLRVVKGKEKSPWRGSHWFAGHPEEETESQTYEE
jgi:hypothetical protein